MNTQIKYAKDFPEHAGALISAIISLEQYLMTVNARNSASELWSFTIDELHTQLHNLTKLAEDVLLIS